MLGLSPGTLLVGLLFAAAFGGRGAFIGYYRGKPRFDSKGAEIVMGAIVLLIGGTYVVRPIYERVTERIQRIEMAWDSAMDVLDPSRHRAVEIPPMCPGSVPELRQMTDGSIALVCPRAVVGLRLPAISVTN